MRLLDTEDIVDEDECDYYSELADEWCDNLFKKFDAIMMIGQFGLWNGPSPAGHIFMDAKELKRFLLSGEYIQIDLMEDDETLIPMQRYCSSWEFGVTKHSLVKIETHHDGTNIFMMKGVTKESVDTYDENKYTFEEYTQFFQDHGLDIMAEDITG